MNRPACCFAKREQHLRVGFVHPEAEGPVIDRFQRIKLFLDHQSHRRVADHPAVDAGDGILCQHRRSVVEFQARPQLEGPGLEIGAGLMALAHLRLRFELIVHAVQRVPDQQPAVAVDVLRGPDRIKVRQVRLRDEAQRFCVRRE